MKKYLLICLLLTVCSGLFAQDKPAAPKSQFILIIRSKTDFSMYSKDSVQTNIKHWMAYMGELGQKGAITSGYRPGGDGIVISSPDSKITTGPYAANNEIVSSFLIIKAANMEEAKSIAQKCPVFELGGSVEVRSLINTAR